MPEKKETISNGKKLRINLQIKNNYKNILPKIDFNKKIYNNFNDESENEEFNKIHAILTEKSMNDNMEDYSSRMNVLNTDINISQNIFKKPFTRISKIEKKSTISEILPIKKTLRNFIRKGTILNVKLNPLKPNNNNNDDDANAAFKNEIKNIKAKNYIGFSTNNLKYLDNKKIIKSAISKIRYNGFVHEMSKSKKINPLIHLIAASYKKLEEERENSIINKNDTSISPLPTSPANFIKSSIKIPNEIEDSERSKCLINSNDNNNTKKTSKEDGVNFFQILRTSTLKYFEKKDSINSDKSKEKSDSSRNKNLISLRLQNKKKKDAINKVTKNNNSNSRRKSLNNKLNTNSNISTDRSINQNKNKKLLNPFRNVVDGMLDLVQDLKSCRILKNKNINK